MLENAFPDLLRQLDALCCGEVEDLLQGMRLMVFLF
jgi:hypothetical protein